MAENLDGEAVLWAAKRLEARTVGTKVLLVISDGLPAAADSNIGELERHLLGVCRTLGAREAEGVHLCGIGVGEERVREFYRNCEVIKEIEDLPGALVGVVGRVLVGAGALG
jgi:cobaltochelatase CobT